MALMPRFTVQLRSQSGSISRTFSGAISIAERIPVRSFTCISLVPHLHLPSAVQSIVGPSHKVLHWTVDGSDFLKFQ